MCIKEFAPFVLPQQFSVQLLTSSPARVATILYSIYCTKQQVVVEHKEEARQSMLAKLVQLAGCLFFKNSKNSQQYLQYLQY